MISLETALSHGGGPPAKEACKQSRDHYISPLTKRRQTPSPNTKPHTSTHTQTHTHTHVHKCQDNVGGKQHSKGPAYYHATQGTNLHSVRHHVTSLETALSHEGGPPVKEACKQSRDHYASPLTKQGKPPPQSRTVTEHRNAGRRKGKMLCC